MLAAATGATLAELMGRLGHGTAAADHGAHDADQPSPNAALISKTTGNVGLNVALGNRIERCPDFVWAELADAHAASDR